MGAGCSNEAATYANAPVPQSGPQARKAEASAEARSKLLKKCFLALDIDRSGYLEVDEWKSYLVAAGVPKAVVDAQASKIMSSMDTNNDNKISFEEFSTALVTLSSRHSDREFAELLTGLVNSCRNAATLAGVTGSQASFGDKLSVELVMKSLAVETRVSKLRLCFNILDADKSGFIEIDEFKSYLLNSVERVDKVTDETAYAQNIKLFLQKMDTDKDQKVSDLEFMGSLSEFKNTVSEEEFDSMVEGIFSACSGIAISSNVLQKALSR